MEPATNGTCGRMKHGSETCVRSAALPHGFMNSPPGSTLCLWNQVRTGYGCRLEHVSMSKRACSYRPCRSMFMIHVHCPCRDRVLRLWTIASASPAQNMFCSSSSCEKVGSSLNDARATRPLPGTTTESCTKQKRRHEDIHRLRVLRTWCIRSLFLFWILELQYIILFADSSLTTWYTISDVYINISPFYGMAPATGRDTAVRRPLLPPNG